MSTQGKLGKIERSARPRGVLQHACWPIPDDR
jgi:hypothetical protein